MKTISVEIISAKEIDLAKVLQKHLRGYAMIQRNDVTIFASDVTKLRTSSTMLNVIVVSSKGRQHYTLDFIAGGGKQGVFIQIDWWSESSEVSRALRTLEQVCEEHNLTLLKPGDSYY